MDRPQLGELLRLVEELPPGELRQLVAEARRRLGGDAVLTSALRLTVTGERPVRVEGADGAGRTVAPREHLDLQPLQVIDRPAGAARGELDLSRGRTRSLLWCRISAPDGPTRVHASLAGLQAGSARFGAPEAFALDPPTAGELPSWRPLDGGATVLEVVPERLLTLLVVGRGLRLDVGRLLAHSPGRERAREQDEEAAGERLTSLAERDEEPA